MHHNIFKIIIKQSPNNSLIMRSYFWTGKSKTNPVYEKKILHSDTKAIFACSIRSVYALCGHICSEYFNNRNS